MIFTKKIEDGRTTQIRSKHFINEKSSYDYFRKGGKKRKGSPDFLKNGDADKASEEKGGKASLDELRGDVPAEKTTQSKLQGKQ